METLYILGGNGFVGKNLVHYLHNKYKISVFSRRIDYDFFKKYPEVDLYVIDLAKDKIPSCLDTPTYIINLVSMVTAERDLSLFMRMVYSNLDVLLNLFDRFKESKKIKLFLQFGSSEEYGNIPSPLHESMREVPNSPYALVKQLTTNTALMLYYNYSFPVTVIRPGNLFGEFQNETKFIPYIIHRMRLNKPIEVSFCEQKRDFIYSEDFSLLISKILDNYTKCIGEIINVSTGNSTSLKDIIEFCKCHLNSSSEILYGSVPYRENEIMNMNCDISKLTSCICDDVTCNIYEGLKKYINNLL